MADWPGEQVAEFSNADKTQMVLIYGEVGRSATAAANLFARRYPEKWAPAEWEFRRFVKRLEKKNRII